MLKENFELNEHDQIILDARRVGRYRELFRDLLAEATIYRSELEDCLIITTTPKAIAKVQARFLELKMAAWYVFEISSIRLFAENQLMAYTSTYPAILTTTAHPRKEENTLDSTTSKEVIGKHGSHKRKAKKRKG